MNESSPARRLRGWSGPLGFALALAAVCVLIAVQQLMTLDGADQLHYAANDALHVPLFAVLTVLIARLLGDPPVPQLVAAVLAVAVLTELLQLATGRDASLVDVGHDLLGMLPVAVGLAAVRRLSRQRRRPWTAVAVWSAVAVLIAAFTVFEPWRIWLAYQQRDQRFPVLLQPQAGVDELLLATRGRLRTVTAPEAWEAFAGQPVLEIEWAHGEPYPGIVLVDVVSDWGDYQTLVVDFYQPDGEPLTLTAALRYATDPPTGSWRWQQVRAGPLRYPLADLLQGHDPRRVAHLVLQATSEDAGRRTLLGRVALE